MNSDALIQVLDIVYQADLMKVTELRNRQTALEKERAKLQEPLLFDHQIECSLELVGATSRYLGWRRIEARSKSRMIFALQPEIMEAKNKLKKSFGRLEAVKELKMNGEF